jgi:uncharacterized protein (TIGR02246 family)
MMKISKSLCIALLVCCAGCGTAPVADTKAKDEADIRALEDRFAAAFKAKDVNAIMALYTPGQDLIVFDVTPPRQYTGWPAYKKDFEDFFAAFPGPADFTITDLDVTVGGDVAFSHSIQHPIMTDKSGKKAEYAVRVTDGYKKINGQWLISHEHVSIPVDMTTMKPDLDLK